MNMRLILPALLFLPGIFFAQQPDTVLLSPQDAVRIALENNFGIRISQGDAEIARLNNTRGNAGMLPTVNFVANESFTISSFQQKLANGTEFNEPGAPFNTANAAVQLSWTLFDGHRMQMAKKRLEELEALGKLNLQEAVEQTAANALQAYYAIVRGRMQERALQELIALNEETLRIAQARLAAGFAAQTDALQASIDLNQRRADLILQQTATNNAKRSLNLVLARPADTPFKVEEQITPDYSPVRETLATRITANNPTLLSLQKSVDIAAGLVEETRALGRARLVGNSQLSALRADNGAGFALSNTQAGLSVGAGLVVPIYAGGNFKRQVEVAKVSAMQSSLALENQRLYLENNLDIQLANYQSQQQILNLEEENVRIARENLHVSTERFRVGTTNGLEPQVAQNSLEQALARRDLVLYNLKTTEIGLRLLAGEL